MKHKFTKFTVTISQIRICWVSATTCDTHHLLCHLFSICIPTTTYYCDVTPSMSLMVHERYIPGTHPSLSARMNHTHTRALGVLQFLGWAQAGLEGVERLCERRVRYNYVNDNEEITYLTSISWAWKSE